ncbi:hypothetical protein D3C87_796250 [compost metagenome]
MLPEEVSIITEEQRDWDDTYIIESGRTYCFEFTHAEGETTEIDFVHTRAQAQDLSLRCWFSEKPYGQQEFPFIDSMDVFYMGRHVRKILIGSPTTDTIYKMPANQRNYLMVQNAQNAENYFKLVFNIKA